MSSSRTAQKQMEIRNLEILRAASTHKVGITSPLLSTFLNGLFPNQLLSPRVLPSSKKIGFEQFHSCGIMYSRIQSSCSVMSDSLQPMGTPLQYSCLENPMDGGAW